MAVPIDDRYVMWLGTDYMGNRAASARLGRTNIELGVLRTHLHGVDCHRAAVVEFERDDFKKAIGRNLALCNYVVYVYLQTVDSAQCPETPALWW